MDVIDGRWWPLLAVSKMVMSHDWRFLNNIIDGRWWPLLAVSKMVMSHDWRFLNNIIELNTTDKTAQP